MCAPGTPPTRARRLPLRPPGLCNGKGDAYRYCKRCHPGAIQRKWTPELVVLAMVQWRERYGRLPSSYDWSRTHARRRGGVALSRLMQREWPAASVVSMLFGSWSAARAAAPDTTMMQVDA